MKRKLSFITALSLLAAVGMFVLPPSQATETKTSAKNATFTKDVAPIFFKNCAECHRPGEAAPFSALTYKDVRPWAKSIREKVTNLAGRSPIHRRLGYRQTRFHHSNAERIRAEAKWAG